MMNYEVLGIATTTRDGKVGTRLVLICDFPEYLHANATRCVGMDTICEFTRLNCSALNVGDTVELQYTRGFQGKAQLVGIKKISTE